MPVLGSGHPQADIFLIKHSPKPAEIEEGVAFYGRAGVGDAEVASSASASTRSRSTARSASSARYAEPVIAAPACPARVGRGVMIVQPRILVVMGEDAIDVGQRARVPRAQVLELRRRDAAPSPHPQKRSSRAGPG